MRTYLLLAAICACGASLQAHEDITADHVTPENVQACVDARLEQNTQDVETIICSLRDKLNELYSNNEIDEETYTACQEALNAYLG